MISLHSVGMEYPEPKRLRDYFLKPFRKREKVTALIDIDIDIQEGDRIAFLGPNGAGKTTLMKLIAGLILPAHGDVIVNGYNTKTQGLDARRCAGYVINEERSFYWRLTGRQNLEFFGTLNNLYGKNLRDRIDDLIHSLDLYNMCDKPVGTYSTGMKQRLAMARGLLTNPEILILDEPVKALDPVSTKEYMELIKERELKHKKNCLLIVTHNLEIAEKLCTRTCIINEHRMVNPLRMDELLNKYRTIEEYYLDGVGYNE